MSNQKKANSNGKTNQGGVRPAADAKVNVQPTSPVAANPEAKADSDGGYEQEQKVVTKTATSAAAAPHKEPGKVLFVSKNREMSGPIMAKGKTFTPFWSKDHEHLIFRVDADCADAFSQHTFVKQGKINRALD